MILAGGVVALDNADERRNDSARVLLGLENSIFALTFISVA